jgi:multiple sugar transport system substrate-binding protein
MKTSRIQKIVALVLTTMMLLSVASFASAQASDTGIVLEWQQWWAVEAPEGYVQNIVDQYYAQTGVKVELLNAPFSDTKTAIVSGATTGTVADIVSVDGSWVYDFADQGILTNLTDLMKEANFDESLLNDQWKAKGATYCLPVVNYAYPMFANMDILNACGITTLPKTWSEFKADCKIITEKGYYPFALNMDTSSPSGIQNTYMGFAWASDITMKNDAGEYAIAGNEQLKTFAEFMKDLYTSGYLYPGMSALTEPDMTSNFSSGNLAFVINSMATLTSYRKNSPDMNIVASPVPVQDGFTGKSGMCVASWALGVTENSKNKVEAIKFIQYLFGGELNADLAVTQSAFPGSTAAKPDYVGADKVFLDVYNMYMNGYPINEFIGMKEANAFMTDYINELIPYMDGSVDVDTFLNNVQAAIDAIYN